MDKDMERRVWQRVYGQRPPARLTPRQRQQIQRSLNQAKDNLAFFESQRSDPVYGEAFHRMATETGEHVKMMRQILGL